MNSGILLVMAAIGLVSTSASAATVQLEPELDRRFALIREEVRQRQGGADTLIDYQKGWNAQREKECERFGFEDEQEPTAGTAACMDEWTKWQLEIYNALNSRIRDVALPKLPSTPMGPAEEELNEFFSDLKRRVDNNPARGTRAAENLSDFQGAWNQVRVETCAKLSPNTFDPVVSSCLEAWSKWQLRVLASVNEQIQKVDAGGGRR